MAMNDFISDAMVTHDISLGRFDAKVRRQILGQLNTMQEDIVGQLSNVDFSNVARRARLEGLLGQVDGIVKKSYSGMNRHMLGEMSDLGGLEQSFQAAKMNQLFGVDIISASLTPERLRVLAKDSNIFGAPAKEWWGRQSAAVRKRFGDQMRQGFLLGETNQQLVQRVRGSATGGFRTVEINGLPKSVRKFSGGIMDVTTREAETLVRTSVNSIANEVRLATYMANTDVIGNIMAQVTLDSRTSDICQSHGNRPDEWTLPDFEPVGGSNSYTGPPPWHFNCRSSLIPITKSWEDLQKQAEGSGATRNQRSVARKLDNNAPKRTRSSMNGQVPRKTGYGDWLKKQPASVQLEVLGTTKRKLWQQGKLNLTQMIDQTGRPLTLHQIQELPSNKDIPLKLPPRQAPVVQPKLPPRTPKPDAFIAPPSGIRTVTLEDLRTLAVGDEYMLNGEAFRVIKKTRSGLESVHWSTRTGKWVTARNRTKLTFGTPPPPPITPTPPGPTTTTAGAPKAVFVDPTNYGTLKVGDIWKDALGNTWKVGTIGKRSIRALPWSVKSNRFLSARNGTSFGFDASTGKAGTIKKFKESTGSIKTNLAKNLEVDESLGRTTDFKKQTSNFKESRLRAINAMADNGFNPKLSSMLTRRTGGSSEFSGRGARTWYMGKQRARGGLSDPLGGRYRGDVNGVYYSGMRALGIAETGSIRQMTATWVHEFGHHLDYALFRENARLYSGTTLTKAVRGARTKLSRAYNEMLGEYDDASSAVARKAGIRKDSKALTGNQMKSNWWELEKHIDGHTQSAYSLFNDREWFAEAHAAYYNQRGSRALMKTWQPKTYEFFRLLNSSEMEVLWDAL